MSDRLVHTVLDALTLAVDGVGVLFTAVAALASTAAIVYVARQTKFVKKSTESAEDAVRVAEDNAAAARESLELSRATFRQSEKARLDARAPRVFVHYDLAAVGSPGTLLWKEDEDSELDWQHAEPGKIFDFNEGLTLFHYLAVTVPVVIRNDGPGSASLTTRGFYRASEEPDRATLQHLLLPNTSLEGFVLLVMVMNHWQMFNEHAVQPEWGAEYDVIGPFTEDVDDHFTTRFTGSVLEPVEGVQFQWRVAPGRGSLDVGTENTKRVYRFHPEK